MPSETEEPLAWPPELEQRLFDAARAGDVDTLAGGLETYPAALHVRDQPYGHTLLHVAARHGRLAAVELLLARGLDPNVREPGDDTGPINWAAAGGHVEVVRRLADAGADVGGAGDDHELEVIGWATCWRGCDDPAHRAVAQLLVERGARHHIFSAIALELADELRRIVAADPASLERTMSHNEDFQRPLHFAVRMGRPSMVALLLELGADPRARDGLGCTAALYAATPDVDRPVLEALRARGEPLDLLTLVALADWTAAEAVLRAQPGVLDSGVLHLAAYRGDVPAVRWLLDHGADPNARWRQWGADMVPLHLAVKHAHTEVVRLLLAAGADPRSRDSMHDSDPAGWADFFGHAGLAQLLRREVQPEA